MARCARSFGRALGSALSLSALLAAPAASAGEKYALGVFHYNIQYVAGGMVGYYAVPNPAIDLDAETIEDLIVTESFAPVLELYQKHPTWGVDIELQGYMLDVLAARHPPVLAMLRSLAMSGQIEVVSFHYSDQYFIAHPRSDWSLSQERDVATFAKYDVPLGKSVFCQEGQSSMGMAAAMKERGYETMIWPKNLWIYQHGDFSPDPLYRFGDIGLVVGGLGVQYKNGAADIEVQWTYFDDGELLATGGLNPYFPDLFKKSDKAMGDYEKSLTALEAQGFSITTTTKYAGAVKKELTLADTPPLIDGTWQPGSTDGPHRWLGGRGGWGANERDNDVQSLAAIAHRELEAAAVIAKQAGLDAAAELDDAQRMLSLGEVSDAEGVNPFRGEVEYGIAHCTESIRVARDVIRDAKAKLGWSEVVIDAEKGSATKGTANPFRGGAGAPRLTLAIDPQGRSGTQAWEDLGSNLTRVALTFAPGDTTTIRVRFPGTLGDELVTTRALDDTEPATYSRSAFTFEHFHLALPIGVVGLGAGRFLIQDQATVHVSAEIFRDTGDVVFSDETAHQDETSTWVFYVLDGTPAEAVALARSINDRRTVAR